MTATLDGQPHFQTNGTPLKDALSPYLRFHAEQSVQWHPWNPQTLELARTLDKPILLSIGYSACHWCQVMSQESFADPVVAAILNEHFISVVVDREELPDLDRVGQLCHQLLTGRQGGWPLNLFLSPTDQTPFYGGTYFPRLAAQGIPPFPDLLTGLISYFRAERASIEAQNQRLRQVLHQLEATPPTAGLDTTELLAQARQQLEERFDAAEGGFGEAPKFAHPALIEYLLACWAHTAASEEPDLKALYMATLTLTRMAEGGLYDHVGGGFFRHCTDRAWTIPHFEKMLPDQGLLIGLYAQAAIATGESLFRAAAQGCADWIIQHLQLASGGFGSSLSADTHGEEGSYYLWDSAKVQDELPADLRDVVVARFNLDAPANFKDKGWHLYARRSLFDVAKALRLEASETQERLADALKQLRQWRFARPASACDEKTLPAYNALAIRGLAIAARTLGRVDYAQAASRALSFVRETHWKGGRLKSVAFNGKTTGHACLDDYVFLADAALQLLQCRYDADDLRFCIELTDAALLHFEDLHGGGFWFTAHDADVFLERGKVFHDSSVPSSNGIAASVLQILGYLLGEERYLTSARNVLNAAATVMTAHPTSHVTLLSALQRQQHPACLVILRGPRSEVRQWSDALAPLYSPDTFVLPLHNEASGLPEGLSTKPVSEVAVAYLSCGSKSLSSANSLSALIRQLRDHIPA